MLKKFTQFTNEKSGIDKDTIVKPSAKSTEKEEKIPKVSEPKVTPKMEKPKKVEKVKENFEFFGKVVSFPSQVKPSVSIVLLENNNISKDKLHYIISRQTEDTLVVLKYNEKAEMKLTEFVNTLMNYYKKNEELKVPFSKIVVEGTDQFSIIKNIPNINFGDRKLIQVLNDDLIKLLK